MTAAVVSCPIGTGMPPTPHPHECVGGTAVRSGDQLLWTISGMLSHHRATTGKASIYNESKNTANRDGSRDSCWTLSQCQECRQMTAWKATTMDGQRFDDLTRSLVQRTSRRRLLKAVTTALAALGAGVAWREPGGAFICRQPGVLCAKDAQCCSESCDPMTHRCGCPGGLMLCGGECVQQWLDPTNCGSCGKVCADNEICCSGVCTDCGNGILCGNCITIPI